MNMNKNIKLSILGSSLVGRAVGKVFARYGFEVIFYDKNRAVLEALASKEAVQQFKIERKRKVNRALNPKRSKIFGSKSNCETASKGYNISSDLEGAVRRSNISFICVSPTTITREFDSSVV